MSLTVQIIEATKDFYHYKGRRPSAVVLGLATYADLLEEIKHGYTLINMPHVPYKDPEIYGFRILVSAKEHEITVL